ncbi:MAG: hypothetical protein K2N05_05945 [Muribaculaceae bacterium]|nr:hypothetical protein [Muribaculaceae bacterium]
MKKTINFILVSFCLLMAVMTAMPAQAQSGSSKSGIVSGFDAGAIINVEDPYSEYPQAFLKENIPSILKNLGFKLSTSTPTKLYTSDRTPIKSKKDTYKKNGISVSYMYSVNKSYEMSELSITFPNTSSRDKFIKSATEIGFKKQSSVSYSLGMLEINIKGNVVKFGLVS